MAEAASPRDALMDASVGYWLRVLGADPMQEVVHDLVLEPVADLPHGLLWSTATKKCGLSSPKGMCDRAA